MSQFAFVFLSAVTMVIASERVYWYIGGISADGVLGISLFYMIPAVAALWALGSGPSQRLHQLILGGAVFAFVVEGVLTPVIYEDGPLPIMAALFVGWHGLFSLVGFWYLTRRWLLDRRRGTIVGAGVAMGIYWGLWSLIYRLPGAFEDFEEPVSVMDPSEFGSYAIVFGSAFVVAHWLLGFVWPDSFAPQRRGRIALFVIIGGYFVLAVLPAVFWAPLKLAVLLGGALWLLRKSREATADEPSIIESLSGRVRLNDAVLLMVMPICAAVTYAASWSLDPSNDAVQLMMELMVFGQVLSGLVAFGWAWRRSTRSGQKEEITVL